MTSSLRSFSSSNVNKLCFRAKIVISSRWLDWTLFDLQPAMWPPNSPDLNPVDYAVWGALQQQVYHNRKFTTVGQLKQAIVEEWNKLSQRFIDRSIDEWRRRLTN